MKTINSLCIINMHYNKFLKCYWSFNTVTVFIVCIVEYCLLKDSLPVSWDLCFWSQLSELCQKMHISRYYYCIKANHMQKTQGFFLDWNYIILQMSQTNYYDVTENG